MIPDKLKSRIFPQPKKSSAVTDEALIKEAQSDLTKFGLTERSAETRLPDVTPYLPHITDTNISHHLWKVAGDQASTYSYYVTHYNYMMFIVYVVKIKHILQIRPYTDLLLELLSSPTLPRPPAWALQPGWSRYCPDTGEVTNYCMLHSVLYNDNDITGDQRAAPRGALPRVRRGGCGDGGPARRDGGGRDEPGLVLLALPAAAARGALPAGSQGGYSGQWSPLFLLTVTM